MTELRQHSHALFLLAFAGTGGSVSHHNEDMNGSTENDDDDCLLRKIHVLLDAQHSDEFLLVALVLLTRIFDTQKLETVWNEYSDTLNEYCCRLPKNKPQYIHVLARIVSRLERDSVACSIHQLLLSALIERVECKAQLSAFDVDLILALNACTPQEGASEMLDIVWQRSDQVTRNSLDSQEEMPELEETADDKLVHDTLHALLTTADENVKQPLKEAVWVTFNTHGPKVCADSTTAVPSWYKPLVLWMSSSGLPQTLGAQAHALVLQCTLELTFACPTEFQQVLLHCKALSVALVNFILFYITSSSPQTSVESQSLAWTTLAAMVQAFHFDWMMLSSGGGTLGNATSLCIILRLATGEWRIQLGKLCVDENNGNDSTAIVNACGQVICAALFHVVHLAEQTQEKFQMQASALLHLRDSLQDALHATVQFLCHASQQQQGEGQQETKAIAGRVLGGLLTEFNVWDGLPNDISTDETLQALSVALQSTNENHGALLPCLVMVLASIEDPDYCTKCLDKHHLLGKTLVDSLVSFWKKLDTDTSSQCLAACQVSELWYSLTAPPSSITAPLRKAILKWIRLQVVNCSTPNVEVFSSAVDCYVVLFGQDEVPSEREAAIVQRALEICESQQTR